MVLLKISRYSQSPRLSFFSQACNFINKETLAFVFSWEFCKIFKSTFLQNTSWPLLFFLRLATLVKKRLWHMCFRVNFCEIFKSTFLQNTSWRLLEDNYNCLFFDRYFYQFYILKYSGTIWKNTFKCPLPCKE